MNTANKITVHMPNDIDSWVKELRDRIAERDTSQHALDVSDARDIIKFDPSNECHLDIRIISVKAEDSIPLLNQEVLTDILRYRHANHQETHIVSTPAYPALMAAIYESSLPMNSLRKIWVNGVDAKYDVYVQRADDPYKGQLCVDLKGTRLMTKNVDIAFGAIHGPDSGDISDWCADCIEFVDSLNKKEEVKAESVDKTVYVETIDDLKIVEIKREKLFDHLRYLVETKELSEEQFNLIEDMQRKAAAFDLMSIKSTDRTETNTLYMTVSNTQDYYGATEYGGKAALEKAEELRKTL